MGDGADGGFGGRRRSAAVVFAEAGARRRVRPFTPGAPCAARSYGNAVRPVRQARKPPRGRSLRRRRTADGRAYVPRPLAPARPHPAAASGSPRDAPPVRRDGRMMREVLRTGISRRLSPPPLRSGGGVGRRSRPTEGASRPPPARPPPSRLLRSRATSPACAGEEKEASHLSRCGMIAGEEHHRRACRRARPRQGPLRLRLRSTPLTRLARGGCPGGRRDARRPSRSSSTSLRRVEHRAGARKEARGERRGADAANVG